MKKIVFLCIASLLISASSYGMQNGCESEPETFRVVFGNGALATTKEAIRARIELTNQLGTTHAGEEITYDLAYNYTSGAFADFLQSIEQYIIQYDHQVMSWLNGIEVFPDAHFEHIKSIYLKEYQIMGPELVDHVEKYHEAILQGQKTLVVSHSQGNFYVNQSKEILEQRQPSVPMKSFGIFGVATPANNVGGENGPYITNDHDIIQMVPGSLPSNWSLHSRDGKEIDPSFGDIEAHAFAKTYLSHKYNLKKEVIEGIKHELDQLQDPPQVIGSGPINVTTTWDLYNTDIDLHILEPNGSHVYYNNKSGTSGFLDWDNRRGSGPEHYYTDCNQLQTGEYSIGVHYFEDKETDDPFDTPRQVTAKTTISTPGSTRTFNSVLYVTGTPYAVDVAKVLVERISDPFNPNRDGKLKYQIISLQP